MRMEIQLFSLISRRGDLGEMLDNIAVCKNGEWYYINSQNAGFAAIIILVTFVISIK